MKHAKPVKTWTAQIFVGLRSGYSDMLHPIAVVADVCYEFCDEVKLCVTITPTEFIYVGGGEPGAIVGLINYPRFPPAESDLEDRALALAAKLKSTLGQRRVSIVMPEQTVMLGEQDD